MKSISKFSLDATNSIDFKISKKDVQGFAFGAKNTFIILYFL
jgi:hypothetical protein